MKESNLKHLPSDKFYVELNNKKVVDISNSCKNFSTLLPQNEKIQTICTQLITNIFYFRDVHSKNGSFLDKHCYDLNYWLHDQLSMFLGRKANNANIYALFTEFKKVWESLINQELFDNTDYICMPKPELFKIPLVKYMKYFLDYLENYETIKNEITTSGEKPNNYCPYISESVQLYHAFKALCSTVLNKYCNKYVKDYTEYNPRTLLHMLSCEGGETSNILHNKGFMPEKLNFQRFNPNSMIPGLSHIPDLPNVLMQSLSGLMENGIGPLNLESLLNTFPSLSNMINSSAYKHVDLVFSVLIFSIEGEEDVDI
ncbi:variable surface protein Vir4-related [Plasmodium vivax]|uniref:Variable surface protein Vir4-related n=2 Tax=Plasmodium vivax TaxID=5855 RepID=A5KCR3_PLAVS|nr:variable surface protein Vir4-related [Plasmodium vivax]EDL42854.1 variable surface protein Vir4-related [Plasmodium vivax]KMZ85837.1 variable surface protein Vir4 [Plasmodium vivax Brazil I]|eukprot:XP_001612628.1 variable surface protein Vir4-related [Plasmodium vivax Sal-1]